MFTVARLSPEAQFQIARAERWLAERDERRHALRQQAEAAARALKSEFGASRVWLFGSLDREWFHAESDVDLAVEGVPADRVTAAWRRVEQIVEATVDLVVLEEADESLRRRILDGGTLLA